MPLLGEELLGGAGDGDSTGALLLLGVHVEGKGEGGLAKGISLSLELLQLTLGDSTELEDEAASGGRLAYKPQVWRRGAQGRGEVNY